MLPKNFSYLWCSIRSGESSQWCGFSGFVFAQKHGLLGGLIFIRASPRKPKPNHREVAQSRLSGWAQSLICSRSKTSKNFCERFLKNIESFIFYSCFWISIGNEALYHGGTALTRLCHKNGMSDGLKVFINIVSASDRHRTSLRS